MLRDIFLQMEIINYKSEIKISKWRSAECLLGYCQKYADSASQGTVRKMQTVPIRVLLEILLALNINSYSSIIFQYIFNVRKIEPSSIDCLVKQLCPWRGLPSVSDLTTDCAMNVILLAQVNVCAVFFDVVDCVKHCITPGQVSTMVFLNLF